jgi:uncharacterized protein
MSRAQTILDTGLLSAAANGETEAAREYLKLGANPDARADWGTPAIVLAAEGGHAAIVEALIARGADIDARREGGETALMTATVHGHAGIVRQLLDAGADLETANHWGKTALHLAVIYDNLVIGGALLDAGASLAALDLDGRTPKDVAQKARQKNFLALIDAAEERRFQKDIEGFSGGLHRDVEINPPVRMKPKPPRPRR